VQYIHTVDIIQSQH